MMTERKWLCLQTKSQKEFKAERHFQQLGYDVYLPKSRVQRNAGGVKRLLVTRDRPLTTGYMFIAIDGYPDWEEINYRHCIMSVLGCDGSPWYLADELIRNLRWHWRQSNRHFSDRRFGRQLARFDVGDSALIKIGPFAGNKIRIEQISGGRTKGIMEVLGGKVVTEVDVVNLEVA